MAICALVDCFVNLLSIARDGQTQRWAKTQLQAQPEIPCSQPQMTSRRQSARAPPRILCSCHPIITQGVARLGSEDFEINGGNCPKGGIAVPDTLTCQIRT